MDAIEQSVEISADGVALEAEIAVPVPAWGMVLLVQGESPDHDHPRVGDVAAALQDAGLATTLLGLLGDADERIDASRCPDSFKVHPLGERVSRSSTGWSSTSMPPDPTSDSSAPVWERLPP
jgi:hypothetical protein